MLSDPCPMKISLEIYKMYASNIQVDVFFFYTNCTFSDS